MRSSSGSSSVIKKFSAQEVSSVADCMTHSLLSGSACTADAALWGYEQGCEFAGRSRLASLSRKEGAP